MFKDQFGKMMEVYIDDIVVKSENTEDHVRDLKEAFEILKALNMNPSPSKCNFAVSSRKFLGHMVTRRGIEASLEQIKAIIELQSPTSLKEVQKMIGRVATLNRLISHSSDRCKMFYDTWRKNKGFQWLEKHQKALHDLKQYLMTPFLAKPKSNEALYVYLSVTNHIVSGVLVREEDGV